MPGAHRAEEETCFSSQTKLKHMETGEPSLCVLLHIRVKEIPSVVLRYDQIACVFRLLSFLVHRKHGASQRRKVGSLDVPHPPARATRAMSHPQAPCVVAARDGMLSAISFPGTLSPNRIFPRRKAGEASRASSKPIVVTRDVLSAFFDRPLRQASIDLGISPTALKSLCRKLQVPLPPAFIDQARHCSSAGPRPRSQCVSLWD